MTEIKPNNTPGRDMATGDVTFTDEYGWVQWDGELFRCPPTHIVAGDGTALNGVQDACLWLLPEGVDQPELVAAKVALDHMHPSLWPAVVAHFYAGAVA